VIGVSDGVEVIRVVIEMWPVPPMVLVTNIEMPHMDGRLLLSLFAVVERKEWRNLPVIITTGSEHFFSDKYPVLRKPYSLERLLELVMEHAKR
jgi:CheY-like chemotaxis protein